MAAVRRRKAKVDPEKAMDREAVRMAAVVLLARRDFISNELRDTLESQGYNPTVAAEVVAELIQGRVVNDARYAENYVATHSDRGQGPLRVAADLKARGLSAELIAAALENGPDWRALAREVRIRKFGLQEPSDWKERARQARFLQYRGFSSDHIRSATGADPDDG